MSNMIHIPLGSIRSKGLAVGVLASCLFTWTLPAKEWDRKRAESAFEEARQLHANIKESSTAPREEYLHCIDHYRQVYRLDPRFDGSDDAVFGAGTLYQEMGEVFENPEYANRALKLYRFLLSDYKTSPHCLEAEQNISQLKQWSGTASSNRRNHGPESQPVAQAKAEVQATGEKREATSDGISLLRSVRHWSTGDYTRVAIDLDVQTQYKRYMLTNPARLYFDIHGSKLSADLGSKPYVVEDDLLKQIRLSQNQPDVVRVVLDLTGVQDYSVFELSDPFRIIVDIRGTNAANSGSDENRPSGNQATPEASEKHVLQPSLDKSEGRSAPALTGTEADIAPRPVATSTRQPIPTAAPKASDPKDQLARDRLSLDPARDIKPPAKPSKSKLPANPAAASHVDSGPVGVVAAEPTAITTLPASRENTMAPPATKVSDVKSASVEPPKAAALTSKGDRTLTRVLGLKIRRIVLDPGHGGHDTGTIGRNGLKEKDLVLEVARELENLLQERLNAEVVLTRTDDTFIPLEERTALANQHQADVFISIHANSSGSRSVSGVETYYLNFATSLDAQEVAARENSSTGRNIRDLPDMVKSITKADKSAESRELAHILQKKLYGSAQRLFPAARNRGVRTAPFVVLIGANMPSVLAEVGFVSNPRDERLLKKMDSRKRLAEALYAGIEGYMKSLGSQLTQASNRAKGSAP